MEFNAQGPAADLIGYSRVMQSEPALSSKKHWNERRRVLEKRCQRRTRKPDQIADSSQSL